MRHTLSQVQVPIMGLAIFFCFTVLCTGSCKKDTESTPARQLAGTYQRGDYSPQELGEGKYNKYLLTPIPGEDSILSVVHLFTKRENKTSLIGELLNAVGLEFITELFGGNTLLQFEYREEGKFSLYLIDEYTGYWEGIAQYSKKSGSPDGWGTELDFKAQNVVIIFKKMNNNEWNITTPGNGDSFIFQRN